MKAALIFLFLLATFARADVTIFTTANGLATGDGATLGMAVNLTRAKARVREVNAAATQDIVVELQGGTYPLTTTLAFTPADGGFNGWRVIWRAAAGQTPVLSGGEVVGGWTAHGATGLWKKTVTSALTRQLYVGDAHRPRARAKTPLNVHSVTKDTANGVRRLLVDPATMPFPAKPAQVEMESHGGIWLQWNVRMSSASLVADPRWAVPRIELVANGSQWGDTGGAVAFPPGTDDAHLENDITLLDEPGEWCSDTDDDTIYYKPLAGEALATFEANIPRLDKLVTIIGTALDAPVRNLRFEGLQFRHAKWTDPSASGLVPVQGADLQRPFYGFMPGAVEVKWAEGVDFISNRFSLLGSTGLYFIEGVTNGTVQGNAFVEIAGSGMQVGQGGQTTGGKTFVAGTPVNLPVETTPRTITVKAIAFKDGMTPSSMTTASYRMNENVATTVAAPLFSVKPGPNPAGTTLTFTSATAGATIRYTIDNATISATQGTIYNPASPPTFSPGQTVRAIAYKSGLGDSAVLQTRYPSLATTGRVEAPAFSLEAGAYGSAQTFTMSGATAGATIRYTVNGDTPTQRPYIPSGLTIADNLFLRNGFDYRNVHAFYSLSIRDSAWSRNQLQDCPYGATQFGSFDSTTQTEAGNIRYNEMGGNTLAQNRIRYFCKYTRDGGGFYINGRAVGTDGLVHQNVVTDNFLQHWWTDEGALYSEDHSAHITYQRNVCESALNVPDLTDVHRWIYAWSGNSFALSFGTGANANYAYVNSDDYEYNPGDKATNPLVAPTGYTLSGTNRVTGNGATDAIIAGIVNNSGPAEPYRSALAPLLPNEVANATPIVTHPVSSITCRLDETIALNASVTDDAIPTDRLYLDWSATTQPSGATVTFSQKNEAITTAAFSHTGSYVLRLQARDGLAAGSANVNVTVTAVTLPTNRAAGILPTVSSTYYGQASNLTDGSFSSDSQNGNGLWLSNGTEAAWFQLDLGVPVTPVRFIMGARNGNADERRDFQVRASNDATFASYVILAEQLTSYPNWGRWCANVVNAGAYRYFRVQSQNTSLSASEFQIFGTPNDSAWWPLDDGAGTTAANAIAPNIAATLTNTAWTSNGVIGQALTFNGTSSSANLLGALPMSATEGTVAVWVKTTMSTNGMIFYGANDIGGNGNGQEREINLNVDLGQARFYLERTNAGGPDIQLIGPAVNDGRWHHLAATWKLGGQAILYVDGAAVASATHDLGNYPLGVLLQLGRPSLAERFFAGTLDDVRLFTRELTAAEIVTAMNGAWSLAEKWRFTSFNTTNNTGPAADSADPDNDGFNNRLERALATLPLAAETTPPVSSQLAASRLALTFRRDPAATDLIYTVVASSDLASWTPIARSTGGAATLNLGGAFSISEGTGSPRSVTVTDSVLSTGGTKRFLRLEIGP